MTKVCAEHKANPFQGYRQCVGCELQSKQNTINVLERALAGMLFAFDDGVGAEWEQDVLDFARKLVAAKEFSK